MDQRYRTTDSTETPLEKIQRVAEDGRLLKEKPTKFVLDNRIPRTKSTRRRFTSYFSCVFRPTLSYLRITTSELLCGPPPKEGAAYCVALCLSVCPSVPLADVLYLQLRRLTTEHPK